MFGITASKIAEMVMGLWKHTTIPYCMFPIINAREADAVSRRLVSGMVRRSVLQLKGHTDRRTPDISARWKWY